MTGHHTVPSDNIKLKVASRAGPPTVRLSGPFLSDELVRVGSDPEVNLPGSCHQEKGPVSAGRSIRETRAATESLF